MSDNSTESTFDKLLNFNIDEKVLCFHGPLIYEAKILQRQWLQEDPEFHGPFYYVHYKGWKNTWDEWVPETRVLRWNETNLRMQQKLKELYTVKKSPSRKSSSSASSSTGDKHQQQQNNKKRSRDSSTDKKEEDYLNRPEIRLDIPDTLKGRLVDDWENVTKNQQLVGLPRNPTVTEILERYRRHKLEKRNGRETNEELLNEVITGIKDYFNKALGSILLYRFERHQYASLHKQFRKQEMVDIYGAEHLLRLFVQLPSLVAQTDMDAEAVAVLTEYLTDILKYMQKNQKQLFLSEYENATPEYLSLSGSI